MTKQHINIGRSANDKGGDPLRTAFDKVNQNFDELFATDTLTKYQLGDDEQFVRIELDGEGVPTGGITIQSGFNTAMPVYIKGGNASQDGVGGNVIIEAGAPPLAAGLIQGGGPYAGTVGDIEIAANQTTIESLGNVWTFGNDGILTLPEGGDIVDSNGDTVLGGSPDRLINGANELVFDANGVLNFPNNNGQIGQLESPYTGLEFRTGAGADWIGISYGEINDNNTSYFYFDKDGSDYLTANHRAHLQIKNPAHDGHVEWLFDSDGSLTLPETSTINISGSSGGFFATGDTDFNVDLNGKHWSFDAGSGQTYLPFGLTVAGDISNSEDLVLKAGQEIWTFGTNGILTLPTDGSIDTYDGTGGFKITTDGQIQFASGYSIGGSDSGLGIRMATDRGTILFGNHPEVQVTSSHHFHIMAQDPTATDLFFGSDANFVKLPRGTEDVVIGNGNNYNWQFGNYGTLTLPLGGTITETGRVTEGGDSPGTIVLTPNNVFNPWNNLTIYNTAFDPETQHIHLASGDLNRTEIVLGNDNKFVKVNIDGSVCVQSSAYYFEGALAFEFQNTDNTITEMHFSLGVYPRLYYVAVGDIITDVSNGHTATITDVIHDSNVSITCSIPMDTNGTSTLGYSFSKPWSTGGLWQFDNNGTLTFPSGTSIGSLEGSAGIFGPNGTDFLINTRFDNTGVYQAWTFGTDGNLTLPNSATISRIDIGLSFSYPTNAGGVWAVDTNSLTLLEVAADIQSNFSNYRINFNGGPTGVAIQGISEGPFGGYILSGTWSSSSTGFPITITSLDYASNLTKITSANGTQIATTGGTWTFGTDGGLTLPAGGAITSPDCNFSFNKDTGNFALPTLGTVISSEGLGVGNTGNSEVYMGSGFGEFRSIYNNNSGTESGLTYSGVEGFNYAQYGDVNFSGIVSQTPNIDSMYTVGLNQDGQIVIGFTQNGQTQASTDWSVTVGTLNTDMTVNGLFANTATTVIGSGLSTWQFKNDGSTVLPSGAGFGIGETGQLKVNDGTTLSLDFRDTSGRGFYTNGDGFSLRGDGDSTWKFGTDGKITLPQYNTSISQYDGETTFAGGTDDIGLQVTVDKTIYLRVGDNQWAFGAGAGGANILQLPTGGDIKNSAGTSVLGATLTLQAKPTTKEGQAGDLKGMVAIDSIGGEFYYCIANYTDGTDPIWAKVAGSTGWI